MSERKAYGLWTLLLPHKLGPILLQNSSYVPLHRFDSDDFQFDYHFPVSPIFLRGRSFSLWSNSKEYSWRWSSSLINPPPSTWKDHIRYISFISDSDVVDLTSFRIVREIISYKYLLPQLRSVILLKLINLIALSSRDRSDMRGNVIISNCVDKKTNIVHRQTRGQCLLNGWQYQKPFKST